MTENDGGLARPGGIWRVSPGQKSFRLIQVISTTGGALGRCGQVIAPSHRGLQERQTSPALDHEARFARHSLTDIIGPAVPARGLPTLGLDC
jgi:hypothetical protein